jgi:hypothetical protein
MEYIMDKTAIKLIGLKKAIGSYNRINKGGRYSRFYGNMMLDCSTGELWVDKFNSIGHNAFKVYHNNEDNHIIDIVKWLSERIMQDNYKIDMHLIKAMSECAIEEYEKKAAEEAAQVL